MSGTVSILNVAAGDTKLTFDKNNAQESIRAARIVRDMLRRGYALLIEVVQPDGSKAYQRAIDFDPETSEYIIADFDPLGGQRNNEEASEESVDATAQNSGETEPPAPRRSRRRVAATDTKAVAVARTAGG